MEEIHQQQLGELLLQLKKGDISVLGDIDKIIGKRLRAHANIYFMQKADLDDSIQTLLCKLYYAARKYDEEGHAYSFVLTVYKNMLKTIRKRRFKEREILIRIAKEEIERNKVSDEYITNYIIINEIFEKLDKKEQELAEHVIFLDLSYAETARILGKPKSTIEYQVMKLKEKIKNMK